MKSDTVKVIQLTDTHLFCSDNQNIFDVKSNLKFDEVIEKILVEDIHDTDMIFLTGDLSQDETEESYKIIASTLMTLNIPIYWIPGNHDDVLKMGSVFSNTDNFIRAKNLSFSDWHFIFLNTKMEGVAEGYLSGSELQLLREELLLSSDDKNIAIVMHHHPARVGTPLIDNYILKNRNEFWGIIAGTNVKLIICGHVHYI